MAGGTPDATGPADPGPRTAPNRPAYPEDGRSGSRLSLYLDLAAPASGGNRRQPPLPGLCPPLLPSFIGSVVIKPPLPVACAVIEDAAGRVLVAQRPAHKHLALKWEFPGGKLEPGESPETALLRELREELDCDALVVRALPRFVHDYGDVHIELFPFVCRLAPNSPAPHPHEHRALRWVLPAELPALDLAQADWPVVASYTAPPPATHPASGRPPVALPAPNPPVPGGSVT